MKKQSISPAHDAAWQAAALAFGMRPLSRAEYEAIFWQPARSARGWKTGVSSHNCIAFLRASIG